MTPYLKCTESNERHLKFTLFDKRGANCGSIVILTDDAYEFLRETWRGGINWDGNIPKKWLDPLWNGKLDTLPDVVG